MSFPVSHFRPKQLVASNQEIELKIQSDCLDKLVSDNAVPLRSSQRIQVKRRESLHEADNSRRRKFGYFWISSDSPAFFIKKLDSKLKRNFTTLSLSHISIDNSFLACQANFQ